MKEKFAEHNFRADALSRIDQCNKIIADYMAEGLRLTLRQLYYQLVSANVITNTERSYQNLSSLVTNARMAGLMDWGAIEDRVRRPKVPNEFENLDSLVEVALSSYRLERWRDQENYVELWVEKDALAGVLAPIASEFHVTLMVNRGYSSASAMYESANRFIRNIKIHNYRNGERDVTWSGKRTMHLLYLGDHDPSGEDMVRDVRDRLTVFGAPLYVKKIALTTAQVGTYKPPPNPAKLTDPRAADYVKKHGAQSWEVDALPPKMLTKIIKKEISALVDMTKMQAIIEEERQDKNRLRKALSMKVEDDGED